MKSKKKRIKSALKNELQFATVEMLKKNSEWYANFVLNKIVELHDEPETKIAIDRGEHNLSVAVAISESNPNKPTKGCFLQREEIKFQANAGSSGL